MEWVESGEGEEERRREAREKVGEKGRGNCNGGNREGKGEG